MKAVRVNKISVLKACGNQFLQRIPPPLVAAPSPLPTQLSGSQMPRPGIRILPSNPCLDLYFHRPMGSGIHSELEFHETLMKQLLPLAWSYNPLTTLKLICNFLDDDGEKRDSEAFYSAAFWLHHNHPKTLACNLLPIAGAWGHILHVLDTLSRVLLQGNAQLQVDQYSMTWIRKDKNQEFQSKQFQIQLTQNARRRTTCPPPPPPPSPRQTRQIKVEKAKEKASALLKRRKTTAMANKAADRYHGDPDYRFLHDRVSDLMAECLKHDIQQFNQHQQQRRQQEHDQKKKKMKTLEFNITGAARCFKFVPPPTDQLLYETVARNVFSPGELESEFSNPMSLRRRLRKEILVPLRQALAPANEEGANSGVIINVWCTTESPMSLMYSLPLRFAMEENGGGRVQKAGEGLNNCLAVCDVAASESVALGMFVSQLSQGPWEGKVVSHTQNPQLHLVRGEDLKSKFSFMHSLEERQDWEVDLGKVYDLILEVAVNENVKAEQMVRKVFVFTCFKHSSDGCWKPRGGDYEEIQRKFEEKGYAVPHLVIWNLIGVGYAPLRTGEPGVTLLGGFSDAMLKSFLENDGELGPELVMELAISPQSYQTLAVFD
ncbi:uncharacterized protein Pyn_37734 [Prunus yedoensis var. nudiflora]|uniref:Uncharacterized protein n=1 Tax=Prunus yedoensis var. nudiflora TaxID=2094558 RepID=A0A314ZGL4_PRUYE|nr:uncharacterized protein Pyn_37734 [Prunus yedoensis var. nudiflora]